MIHIYVLYMLFDLRKDGKECIQDDGRWYKKREGGEEEEEGGHFTFYGSIDHATSSGDCARSFSCAYSGRYFAVKSFSLAHSSPIRFSARRP